MILNSDVSKKQYCVCVCVCELGNELENRVDKLATSKSSPL